MNVPEIVFLRAAPVTGHCASLDKVLSFCCLSCLLPLSVSGVGYRKIGVGVPGKIRSCSIFLGKKCSLAASPLGKVLRFCYQDFSFGKRVSAHSVGGAQIAPCPAEINVLREAVIGEIDCFYRGD